MSFPQTATVVPVYTDGHGTVRVGGTRVTLETVLLTFLEGATSEEIVQRYPALALADVYAVIAWYLNNRVEVERYMASQAAEADRWKARVQDQFPADHLRARLLDRQKKR